jgi:K+-transporting ATPase ATPase A chain
MEGKEVRFGIADSALWATATTAASNGSVNAMHDSFTPLGGLVPMWLMQLGEVVFGGVGSGLYGMLMFAIVAVFIAGLMVGRTPEYLGKKIEAYEMKMASLAILVPCFVVLVGTASPSSTAGARVKGLATPARTASARSSTRSRRRATTTAARSAACRRTRPSTTRARLAMLFGALLGAVPVLAIAGSLAAKKSPSPQGPGTLPDAHWPAVRAAARGRRRARRRADLRARAGPWAHRRASGELPVHLSIPNDPGSERAALDGPAPTGAALRPSIVTAAVARASASSTRAPDPQPRHVRGVGRQPC